MNRFLPVVIFVLFTTHLQAASLTLTDAMTLAGKSTFVGPMIDDFNYPNEAEVIFSKDGNPQTLLHDDPDVIGGERQVFVEAWGMENDVSWGVMVGWCPELGDGELVVATGGNPGTFVRAEYNDIGLLDLTSYSGFEIGFPGIDAGSDTTLLKLDIEVRGLRGLATYQGFVPESVGPTSITVPFEGFIIDGVDPFGAAKDLAFSFNAPNGRDPIPNIDFEVGHIKLVPEPHGLVLLLSALLALVWFYRICQSSRVRQH